MSWEEWIKSLVKVLNLTRAISPLQLDQIRELLQEYARLRKFDAALGDFEAELSGLPGKYAPPEGCLLLATWGEAPAGLIAFQHIGSGVCEMKRMYVSPGFRGKGIGGALIDQLIRIAVNSGYHTMRLDTHPWMKDAQKLYRSKGFYEIERYNRNPTPGIRFFEKIIADGSSSAPD